MTSLPVPEQWTLAKLTDREVAEEIERLVNYVDDNGRSVHLPMEFVRHYTTRHDSPLPTVVAIATLPIVLADGGVLGEERGLDEERGISFIIQPEVMTLLPRPEEVTPDAVARAMKFLTDEWLCDVATDYAGKCTVVAAALSIIERSLLDSRPAFFIVAGRRGSGKTTTLIMLIRAVTGDLARRGGVVAERRGAAQGADVVLPRWRAVHSVGQHPARHPDQLPSHRARMHVSLLH